MTAEAQAIWTTSCHLGVPTTSPHRQSGIAMGVYVSHIGFMCTAGRAVRVVIDPRSLIRLARHDAGSDRTAARSGWEVGHAGLK